MFLKHCAVMFAPDLFLGMEGVRRQGRDKVEIRCSLACMFTLHSMCIGCGHTELKNCDLMHIRSDVL